jgi:hypothetical protein
LDEICNSLLASSTHLPADVSKAQAELSLYTAEVAEAEKTIKQFLPLDVYEKLPPRYQKSIEAAVTLFSFLEKKKGHDFGC